MIHIRHAIISDAKYIAKVHVSSWQVIYRGHIPNHVLDNLSIVEREEIWKNLLENNVNVIVIEKDKNIIGFISYCPTRDEDAGQKIVAEISSVYLHPDFWRKGFGTLLFNTALDEIKSSGYDEVTLWVLEDNQQANLFYEKIGFVKCSDFKTEKKDGYILREVRYRKLID